MNLPADSMLNRAPTDDTASALDTLTPGLLMPHELRPFASEFSETPHFEVYEDIRTVFWPSLGDDRCDGLIVAHGEHFDSWADCASQVEQLREELALKGLAPWTVVASVGGHDLDPDSRYDLAIVARLFISNELNWLAFAEYRAISNNSSVCTRLIAEFGSDYTLPFSNPAPVAGTAGQGALLDHARFDEYRARFLSQPRIKVSQWGSAPNTHGAYALFPTSEALSDPDTRELLKSDGNEEAPVYIGRTLDELLPDRLERHAARIDGAVNLELDWFEVRILEAPDARLAYRGKRVLRRHFDPPAWQRTGFAL